MDANFTIVTIVYVVTLIVPGVIFKRFYFQGHFNKQFQSGLFADRLITSLFWGLFVQIISFLLFVQIFDVEYDSIQDLLRTTHHQLSQNEMPILEKEVLINVFYYLLVSVILAAMFGMLIHIFVRMFRLDLYFGVFRFSNKWYYYFTGEILNTSEFKAKGKRKGKSQATLVDVLVNYGEGKNQLFSGNLTQYSLTPQGNLETLYLTGVLRYKKDDNGNVTTRIIPGDCFVIPYHNVLDMNVNYIFDNAEKKPTLTRLKRFLQTIFSVIMFLLLPSLLIFPWFADTGIGFRILGVLTFFLAWLFFLAWSSNLNKPEGQLQKESLWVAFILFLIFFSLGYYFLDLPLKFF